MDVSEQISKFKEFIELTYHADLLEKARTGGKFLVIDFSELMKFDPELADILLETPEDVIKAGERAIEQFELPEEVKGFKLRIRNVPKNQKISIKNIRSEHLNKLISIEGLVRQKSDVRPQVTIAKFECPECGNTIPVLQTEATFKEPTKCSCGRKGRFKLIDKELIDAQKLVIEESPEDLEGGEQPKRINVILKCDLVSPLSEKKTNPGSKVEIIGSVKEVPIIGKTGTKLILFDLMIDANYVEAKEESYGDIEIKPEEEIQIKDIAKNKDCIKNLVTSIAPSIYGHDEVKEALLLQMLSGVRKKRDDGTIIRGDIHVLLLGDPGCISGESQVALAYKGMEQIKNLGKSHLQQIKEVVTKIRRDAKDKPYDFATRFHYYRNQPVLKLKTETGKEIICTYNQPFLTRAGWKRADELLPDEEIRVMPKIPNTIKNLAPTEFTKVERKTGKLKDVKIPENFTPALASLCGYIIGDGHVNKRGYSVALYVNKEEKDLVPQLFALCQSTFNITPSINIKTVNDNMRTIDDGNGLLRQIISTQSLCVLELNSRQVAQSLSILADKRVPQQIFKSPKQVVARFVSWLFEADGCAFGNGRGRTSIQLKSKTKELLQDVQLLLLYFGIQSRIIEDNLCIRRSRDMELFAKHIGFNSTKKKKALNSVLEIVQMRNTANKRKNPQQYERVAVIAPAGVRDVYDFEVPVTNMFIANGIVCHNSGKSQLLKRITNVAPKSRYVSGKGASGAGLTAAVVKDEFLKGWSLEAGALTLTNKGLCAVDEFDKMSEEDRDAMHEALEQQCMLPDFKLMLSDGRYVEIGKYVDGLINQNSECIYKGINCEILPVKNVELLSTDFTSHFPVMAARVSRHVAPKNFVKIELTNGRIISVTPEHPCWVVKNGRILTVPAARLKNNMFFPIPSEIKIKCKRYEQKKDDLCKIIGYHLSDGCYELNRGKKTGIQFWNNDEILIRDYKKAVENFFNVRPIITRRRHQFAVRVISKKVLEYVREMSGNLLDKGDVKKIPDEIMNLSNKNLRYLLRALYDGDGTVVFQKRNGCRVSLVSQNRALIEQTSDLLLRFGIQSSIFRDNSGNVWKLDTSGQENLLKFFTKIGFLSKHKEQRLKQYCAKTKKYRTIKDIVPGCADKINEIFKHAGLSAKREIGHTIDLGVEKHRVFLQKLVRIAIKKTTKHKGVFQSKIMDDLKELEKLAFGYARWMKIKRVSKIKNNGVKWVYDVTIEPHHTFISNGMILHNTVSIAKANIQATLRAETTVLAAANPKLSRFDLNRPIGEQINLPSTIISRFDLIFPIKDIPNKAKDEKMADFILTMHQDSKTQEVPIDTALLRKYIAYAKQKITPKLTKGAFDEIKDYYVSMRGMSTLEGGFSQVTITARQLEALVRLSEASAKAKLSDKVTRKDAQKAKDLVHYSLSQFGMDKETGRIDIDRIITGVPASQRNKIIKIKEIIETLEQKTKPVPIEDVIKAAEEQGISRSEVEETIQKLIRSGDVYEPRKEFVQKL